MCRVKMGHRTCQLGVAMVAAAAAVISACVFDSRTTSCEVSGRRCAPGQVCAARQDACVDAGGCGDGIVEPDKGEVCDDGNILAGDGCSADCRSTETCGNGILDTVDPAHPKEACDDGNLVDGDGCSSTCTLEACGDGVYNVGEECDTRGNTQACNANCTIPACGDGISNPAFLPFRAQEPEECDNGSADGTLDHVADTRSCNGNNHGFDGPGSCRMPLCGDGYTNTAFTPAGTADPEACDNLGGIDTAECNGNNAGAAGPARCQLPSCGDGYTNRASRPDGSRLVEACDTAGDSPTCNGDGNHDPLSNADARCQVPLCGDGYVNHRFSPSGFGPGEACDTGGDSPTCNGGGNGDPTHPPESECQVPSCGDGYLNRRFKPPGATRTEECETNVDCVIGQCVHCNCV